MTVAKRREGHSHSPIGTAPMPVRLATKHKRPDYGPHLMARHAARKVRRANATTVPERNTVRP